ncbi:hypothetical protein ACSSS7_005577 [Eimeria intestinalis]
MPEIGGKGKEALKRAKARLSLISAFNAAAAELQPPDPKQYGYEADALARQDSLRQHLGQGLGLGVQGSRLRVQGLQLRMV